MAISFQIDIDLRRLTECQTPYSSKLRGKIVRAQQRGNKVLQQDRFVERIE
jgi:hypothetical protein